MGKNVIRLNEDKLRRIIAECVNEALGEGKFDVVGSGLDDYQGTGSEESTERLKKIREKSKKLNGYDPSVKMPGRVHEKNVQTDCWSNALRSFGGPKAKDSFASFDELVKPLHDKLYSVPNGIENDEAHKALSRLYWDMYVVYKDWAEKNRGRSFKNGNGNME